MEDPRRFLPSAIEIYSRHVASEVAIDYAVNVDHGKYLHHIVLENVLGLGCVFDEIPHKPFCHIGRAYFARMLPRHYHNQLLLSSLGLPQPSSLGIGISGSDCDFGH